MPVVPPLSNDDMRASDRDRDHAVAILLRAHADGRLDAGDTRDRTCAAYGARTWGDLRRLTADLPGWPGFPGWPAGAHAPAGPPRGRADVAGPAGARPVAPILLVTLAALTMAAAIVMASVPLAALPLIVASMSALFAAGIAATAGCSGGCVNDF